MPDDEVIEHQEEVSGDTVVTEMQQDVAEEPQEEKTGKTVPLDTHIKERKKRQESETNAQFQQQQNLILQQQILQMQQMQTPKEPVDDSSKYESATKEDLEKMQAEAIRIIEERQWKKSNPEKCQRVDEHLLQFLKQRPNLASAIDSASNRYEEAYTLMEALTPKQQQQLKAQAVKKEAPNSPTGVPKMAAINEVVDLRSMDDKQFNEWRKGKQRRR